MRRPGRNRRFATIVSGGGVAPDLTAPLLQSATVASNGESIALVYNENLDTGSVPSIGDYSLAGTILGISSVGVSGATVTLTLNGVILSTVSSITVDYTAGVNPVQDIAGNNAANLNDQAVTNSSTIVSAFTTSTFFSSGTWTSPNVDGTARVELRGSGAGGVTNTRGGGGGAYSRLNAFAYAVSTGYSVSIGTGGAGGGGTGGNTTFNSTSCMAEGGGQTGTSSDGGRASASIGDVKFDGGAGSIGTGNQSGGGSAGSGGAAGTAPVPGEPNGAAGGNTNIGEGAKNPGGGGRGGLSNEWPGANGQARITTVRAASSVFPNFVEIEQGRDTNNLTTRNVTLPSGSNGDLLICFVSSDGNPTITMTGWTSIGSSSSGTDVTGQAFYRVANGSDGVAIDTSASEQVNWVVVRLRNAGTPTGTFTNASSTNPNPPSHSPGSGNYIAFVFIAMDCLTTGGNLTAFPSGYNGIYVPARAVTAASNNVVCWREFTGSTEDPGAATASTSPHVVATITVPRG